MKVPGIIFFFVIFKLWNENMESSKVVFKVASKPCRDICGLLLERFCLQGWSPKQSLCYCSHRRQDTCTDLPEACASLPDKSFHTCSGESLETISLVIKLAIRCFSIITYEYLIKWPFSEPDDVNRGERSIVRFCEAWNVIVNEFFRHVATNTLHVDCHEFFRRGATRAKNSSE